MKKTSVIILSLLASASILAGCNNSNSSSQKDESASNNSQSNTSSQTSPDSTNNAENGKFTLAFTDKINEKNYKIDTTYSYHDKELNEDKVFSIITAEKGNNAFIKFDTFGEKTELYIVDSTSYDLKLDSKTYTIPQKTSENINTPFLEYIIDDTFEFTQSKQEDDLTVETYKCIENASDSSSKEYTYDYYFDSNGDIKKIVKTYMENKIEQKFTFTINSLEFDIEDITVPDLTDWKEIDPNSALDYDVSLSF